MSIKSSIMTDANGNVTIHIEGDLNYEHSIPFRKHLVSITDENPQAKITLDLGGVDFVGSSGICHFVETIKLVNKNDSTKISLSNVRSEFLKVFKLYDLTEQDVIIDLFDFDTNDTEKLNYIYGNRRRTFEN